MNDRDDGKESKAVERSGGFTRRSTLKAGASLLATAALVPSLSQTGARAATPNRGAHVKIGAHQAASTDSLDPTTYVSIFPYTASYAWGNTLFSISNNMELVPEIAEGFDVEPGAKKWVLKIRKGVEFHNGKSLTAKDVVYSINRHRAKEAGSGLRPLLAQINEMKATGSHEVTFELRGGSADWPYILSDYHVMMQSEGEPVHKGIGTGPYVVEKFEPGVRFIAKRNPNYWNSDVAHYETVELVGINDTTARTSALQTGEVDVALQLPAAIVSLLKRVGLNVFIGPATGFGEFVGHSKDAPFTNNDLRLALKYAVDRREIMDKVFFGHAELANDHAIPSFFRFHAKDLPQHSYDPDKASFHYKKSGHSGPLPEMSTTQIVFAGSGLEVAELFQQQAKRAGIEIPLKRVPAAGYWANSWNKSAFFCGGWFGRPTEDQMLTSAYHSEALYNAYQIAEPKIDQLLVQARAEIDEAKRRQQYADIQEWVWANGSTVIPFFYTNRVGLAKKVQNFAQNPLSDGKFIERIYEES